jgi:hypothetical protein
VKYLNHLIYILRLAQGSSVLSLEVQGLTT